MHFTSVKKKKKKKKIGVARPTLSPYSTAVLLKECYCPRVLASLVGGTWLPVRTLACLALLQHSHLGLPIACKSKARRLALWHALLAQFLSQVQLPCLAPMINVGPHTLKMCLQSTLHALSTFQMPSACSAMGPFH